MSKQIPSKPTVFSGIQYRSRLEARWAVFFTSLKINFSYESIVFEQPGTEITYTPDFVIPTRYKNTSFYIEVKPAYPTKQYIEFIQNFLTKKDLSCLVITIGDFFQSNIPYLLLPINNSTTTLDNWCMRIFRTNAKDFRKHLKVAATYRFDI